MNVLRRTIWSHPNDVPLHLFDGGRLPVATVSGVGFTLEIHSRADARTGYVVVWGGYTSTHRRSTTVTLEVFEGPVPDAWLAAMEYVALTVHEGLVAEVA